MTPANSHTRIPIGLAAVAAVLGYALIWTCFRPTVFSGTKSDFSCFYRAGRMAVAGDGSQIYDLQAERSYDQRLGTSFIDGHGRRFSLPFVFPPYVLVLLAPLACLPYRMAELVWFTANAGMLLALPFALPSAFSRSHQTIAAGLIAPLCFLPAVLALMQGQPTILLLLLFATACTSLLRGPQARAGVVLAFTTLKPQLVLPMLLALLIWRRWRALAAFAAACAALLAISVAVVGWHATWSYPTAVVAFNHLAGSLGGEHPESMPSLRGCLYVLLQNRLSTAALALITIALSVALLFALALLLRRAANPSPTSYSLVIVVTLLVSYHAYLHDDTLLLLPILIMAERILRTRCTLNHIALATIVAALYLLPLLPSSLSATALQMCAMLVAFAVLLAFELRNETTHPPLIDDEQFYRVPALGR